jgi:hypothetical protein
MVVNSSSNIKMEAVSTVALCEVKKSKAEYMKEYREKNREKTREASNKYYNKKKDDSTFKDLRKEKSREYRIQVKEKLEKLKELEKLVIN